MRTCLFWVKKKNTDKEIFIPVFDVLEGVNAQFLVYEDNQFYYKLADDYEPVGNDWQTCCNLGGE